MNIDVDGPVSLRRGRDYIAADGRSLDWTGGPWPDLTGAAIVLLVATPGNRVARYEFAGSVVGSVARVELTAAQLAIAANDYAYELVATLASGRRVTLSVGPFRVLLGRDEPA